MGLQEDFEAAAEAAKGLPSAVTNDDKLQLYGLYKQATVGDVNTAKPGMLSLDLTARSKWDAWDKVKGMSQDDAKTAYIKLVADLQAKYAK